MSAWFMNTGEGGRGQSTPGKLSEKSMIFAGGGYYVGKSLFPP